MKTQFGFAAIALVLSAGTALAQTTIITEQPAVPGTIITEQPGTIITRAPTPIVRERVELTPVQRSTVYRTIIRERPVAAAPAAVEVQVGARIPAGAQLYSVPESVAVEVPTVKSYKYMMVNNRVLLVDPATGTVVGELAE
jgi:hypothetical protein